MAEEWVNAPGFPRYEVSDLGRVRHKKSKKVRAHVYDGRGYDTLNLSTDDGVRRKQVHRIVCEAFHGPPGSSDAWALHRDGDRKNNRADNLYWGDNSDNQLDAVRHGTHPMSRRTHCPQGHEYTSENTYNRTDGRRGRICRACARDYFRRKAGH